MTHLHEKSHQNGPFSTSSGSFTKTVHLNLWSFESFKQSVWPFRLFSGISSARPCHFKKQFVNVRNCVFHFFNLLSSLVSIFSILLSKSWWCSGSGGGAVGGGPSCSSAEFLRPVRGTSRSRSWIWEILLSKSWWCFSMLSSLLSKSCCCLWILSRGIFSAVLTDRTSFPSGSSRTTKKMGHSWSCAPTGISICQTNQESRKWCTSFPSMRKKNKHTGKHTRNIINRQREASNEQDKKHDAAKSTKAYK